MYAASKRPLSALDPFWDEGNAAQGAWTAFKEQCVDAPQQQLQKLVVDHLAVLVVRVLLRQQVGVARGLAEDFHELFDAELRVKAPGLFKHAEHVVKGHGPVVGSHRALLDLVGLV